MPKRSISESSSLSFGSSFCSGFEPCFGMEGLIDQISTGAAKQKIGAFRLIDYGRSLPKILLHHEIDPRRIDTISLREQTCATKPLGEDNNESSCRQQIGIVVGGRRSNRIGQRGLCS